MQKFAAIGSGFLLHKICDFLWLSVWLVFTLFLFLSIRLYSLDPYTDFYVKYVRRRRPGYVSALGGPDNYVWLFVG